MSSDNLRLRPVPALPFASAGSRWTMRCGKCNKQMPNLGRRQVKLGGGVKIMVGPCCQRGNA